MKIKICGIKTFEAAQTALEAGATHIGFIFFEKSPRNISVAKAVEISKKIGDKIKKVAVVVDVDDRFLDEITSVLTPDYIQLHGSETSARAREIKSKFGRKIIKAIPVSEKADLEKADEYKAIADYIMFDAKPPKDSVLPGGNAVSFDWEILKNFSPEYSWILSGGLNPGNVKAAIKTTSAKFVDVSSGVESSPGNKDLNLIRAFINNCVNI